MKQSKIKETSKRYAVIDIGTRGIRLLIADASPQGIDRVVYSTGEMGELGRGVTSTGRLSAASMANVKDIVSKYVDICRKHQVDKLAAIGTEVLRVAKNQGAFLKKLAPIVEIKVLKLQEEALFSFLAAANAFSDGLRPGDMILVIDQGGGSVELSCGSIEKDVSYVLRGFDSLGIGTVALSKMLTEAKTLNDGYIRVMDSVECAIKDHRKFSILKEKEPAVIIALGSAISTLAMQLNGRGKNTLKQMHGYFIAKKDIEKVISRTKNVLVQLGHAPKSNHKNPELAVDSNYATMFCGILTYSCVLQKYGGKGVIVSRHGLSYGTLLWLAGKTVQINLAIE